MKLKTLIYITAITTPILSLIMYLHGAPLKGGEITRHGIVDLELAGTVAKATEIYEAWGPTLINRAINNIFIDFLFLISYGVLLSAACLSISRLFHNFIRKLGRIISYLMIAAASFDVFENILMLSTLSAHFKKEIVASTYIFALIKFILVALGIAYIILALITRGFVRQNKLVSTSS